MLSIYSFSYRNQMLVLMWYCWGMSNANFHMKSWRYREVCPCPCSLDEECRVSTCTEALGVRNRQLQTSLKTFTSSLSRLQTHISCLRAQSRFTCDNTECMCDVIRNYSIRPSTGSFQNFYIWYQTKCFGMGG